MGATSRSRDCIALSDSDLSDCRLGRDCISRRRTTVVGFKNELENRWVRAGGIFGVDLLDRDARSFGRLCSRDSDNELLPARVAGVANGIGLSPTDGGGLDAEAGWGFR
jgi:hypothetical protein